MLITDILRYAARLMMTNFVKIRSPLATAI